MGQHANHGGGRGANIVVKPLTSRVEDEYETSDVPVLVGDIIDGEKVRFVAPNDDGTWEWR